MSVINARLSHLTHEFYNCIYDKSNSYFFINETINDIDPKKNHRTPNIKYIVPSKKLIVHLRYTLKRGQKFISIGKKPILSSKGSPEAYNCIKTCPAFSIVAQECGSHVFASAPLLPTCVFNLTD